ncbi:MAG: Re/Si-specific NAD(P)(+) transhydrogenase subunit alpha [Kiritimatiellae bacterium]|nr:Re/Si-specific NAD(P)(+) transhydrogenase subunit alpha [Kiritimatiellia bacterium]
MKVFCPRETRPGETRVPVTPASAERLVRLGVEVAVEAGLGATIGAADADYTARGVQILSREEGLATADWVFRLRPPPPEEAAAARPDSFHIGFLEPFTNRPLIEAFARSGATALSVELIPRTTIAQKMDALSSQANLAGYVAVILAAERLPKILPMMMTPAGTIAPARVLVIGAGVAGLQAIATARRLGARVEAYDTRPVVKEQVQSLGAKFVDIDVGETGQTKDGYAKQLTEEQLARQRAALARHCAEADVVITTAQVFGRRAPRIITAEMLNGMRPGSVVVDLAVETGGNVEGVEPDREIDRNGVRILGLSNLPGRVPVAASQMYAANLANFLEHFWDRNAKTFRWSDEDEILKGMTVTRGGRVVHAAVRESLGL